MPLKNKIHQTIEKMVSKTSIRTRQTAFRVLQRSLRTSAANEYLKKQNTVLSGEFKGLKLPSAVSEQNYTFGHILGVYEPHVQKIIQEHAPKMKRFVDIGCASGFFSVGVPFAYGVNSIGFDTDDTQISYARDVAKLNGLEEKAKHQKVAIEQDYNQLLQAGDFCLIDIDGGEINLMQSISNEIRSQTTWLIELHEIGSKSVSDVRHALISMMSSTHDHFLYNEKIDLNFEDIMDFENISRDDYVFMSNSQRGFFQEWILFTPKAPSNS